MLLPPYVFENRRDRVKASLPDGAVAIVAAHAEVVRSRDSDYPFRQSSDFWYLTGFTEPDAVLILRLKYGQGDVWGQSVCVLDWGFRTLIRSMHWMR
jgi:Xaa-Pro aminopeptidase